MTDTIEWGDDERPRRVWLTRRRRIALAVVGALIAGAVVAWPPFRSWRADIAAAQVQHIWERVQGYDNARVVTLAGAQQRISVLDQAPFARAVTTIETEEAADLDRLARQAKSMRTWEPDVDAARDAVVAATTAQANGLRSQASHPETITVDFAITTAVNPDASSAGVTAFAKLNALRKRHHLTTFVPTSENFHTATDLLAALRRPTDEPLHLHLVTAGVGGITVTDLDTGRVTVRRPLDSPDSASWLSERLFGHSIVGTAADDTLIIPLSPSEPEHLVHSAFVRSSSGSPMWVSSFLNANIRAVDESGRQVGAPVTLPDGLSLTGLGTGTVLLVTTPAEGEVNGPGQPSPLYLLRPGSAHKVKLALTGCPQLPALDGGLIVVPTGNICDYATRLQLFDLSGRLVRTVAVPAGEVVTAPGVCAPDGKHVAVATADVSSNDLFVPTTVRMLDTETGAWLPIEVPSGWIPLSWTPDGKTLLLQETDNSRFSAGQQFGQLAYFRVGDTGVHPIRVAPGESNFLV